MEGCLNGLLRKFLVEAIGAIAHVLPEKQSLPMHGFICRIRCFSNGYRYI